MKSPAALLTIDEDIRRAEFLVQDRQLRLAHRATQAERLMRERVAGMKARVTGLLKPAALVTAGSTAALLLLSRRRRPVAASTDTRPDTRPSARTAAFIAPLVTRLLAPSLGRDVATLVSTIVLPFAFGGQSKPRTAPLVRWPRYMGHWFELAQLGGRFSPPAHDATITYLPEGRSSQRLRVIARYLRADGRVTQREGIARVQPGRGEARVKVTFARGLGRLLPGAWADYWVLDVAADYSAAMMGTPDRKHLWLLGRSPEVDSQLLERMINRAAAQGYDVGRLVPINHRPAARGPRHLRRS
jgi:apolipoprotein D and lipocalin family protein